MRRLKILVIIAILVGSALRLWRLGENPPSLSWDEAALGYNAYSILKTGKDEWGAAWPLTLKSFHDYKPALYAYLTIPSVYLFDLNALAVRLPSALAGILALVTVPFLAYKLGRLIKETDRSETAWVVAALSTWLLAISPWHLQFSRGAFEANLSLTLFILGATFFVWATEYLWLLPVAMIPLGFSLYAYHAPRLIVPLWLIGAGLILRQKLSGSAVWGKMALLTIALLGLPLIRIAQYGGLTSRFQAVKIEPGQATDLTGNGLLNHPRLEFGRTLISGYFAHLNPQYLVIKGDATDLEPKARHRAVDTGVMLWLTLPFFWYGLCRLVGFQGPGKGIVLLWLGLGPFPASFTKEAPHAIRSILMLPSLQIITALGLVMAFERWRSWSKLAIGILLALFGLNMAVYLHDYYVHTPQEWSSYWQDGYQQAVIETQKLASGYQRVVVTRKYDQPYIFFLFYGQVDPAWYQLNGGQEGFGPYQFRQVDLETESKAKTLFVLAPDEAGEKGRVLKTIYFLNGEEAFRIVDFREGDVP